MKDVMKTDDPLETQIGDELKMRGWSLAVAESCTGGLLGHLITEVPGSSDYFMGGVLVYSDQAKTKLLGVDPEILQKHGAVSSQVARRMAIAVRELLQTDVGLSVTGIAGPGGGFPEKPVGLTYIGLSSPRADVVEEITWGSTRSQNKLSSAQAAMRLLLQSLEDIS
jgi:PncC family amidohydrolase